MQSVLHNLAITAPNTPHCMHSLDEMQYGVDRVDMDAEVRVFGWCTHNTQPPCMTAAQLGPQRRRIR